MTSPSGLPTEINLMRELRLTFPLKKHLSDFKCKLCASLTTLSFIPQALKTLRSGDIGFAEGYIDVESRAKLSQASHPKLSH